MAIDVYKEIGRIDKDVLVEYNGKSVMVKDTHNGDILFGGTLDFDMKDPEVYYLNKDSISRRFQVHDLEKLIVSLDS
jgi:hypothetical protein